MKNLIRTSLLYLRIKIQKFIGIKICPRCTKGMRFDKAPTQGWECKCGYRKDINGKEWFNGKQMVNVGEIMQKGNRKTRRALKAILKKQHG